MKIINKTPKELHSEQGFDLVEKEVWEKFELTKEQPINDTYRFKVAYLPDSITLEMCQEMYLEVEELK